jgi:hypothetical protein
VDGDLFLVDPSGRLGGGLVLLLVAATGQQDGQNGHGHNGNAARWHAA